MADFMGILQLTAGGMANPGVAINGFHVRPILGGLQLIKAHCVVNSAVGNNGIHLWPISGRSYSSFKRMVWQVQEWPIMGSMYGQFHGVRCSFKRIVWYVRSGQQWKPFWPISGGYYSSFTVSA